MHRALRGMLGELIQSNATENIQPLLTYEMAIACGSAKQKRHGPVVDTQEERGQPWEIGAGPN